MLRLDSYSKSHRLYKMALTEELISTGFIKGNIEVLYDRDYANEYVIQAYAVDRSNTSSNGNVQVVMQLELSRSKESNCRVWQVDGCVSDRRYQGFGLGPLMYIHLLRKTNFVIHAGEQQSWGGRYIWKKLVEHPKISVVARRGKEHTWVEVDDVNEDGEITTPFYHCYYDCMMSDEDARANLNLVQVYAYASN